MKNWKNWFEVSLCNCCWCRSEDEIQKFSTKLFQKPKKKGAVVDQTPLQSICLSSAGILSWRKSIKQPFLLKVSSLSSVEDSELCTLRQRRPQHPRLWIKVSLTFTMSHVEQHCGSTPDQVEEVDWIWYVGVEYYDVLWYGVNFPKHCIDF